MCTLPRPCLFPFRAPATTDPYTLSLHDALPISGGSTTTRRRRRPRVGFAGIGWIGKNRLNAIREADIIELVAVADPHSEALARSEEHTSELQSRGHLVCRLLLEKKEPNDSHEQRN